MYRVPSSTERSRLSGCLGPGLLVLVVEASLDTLPPPAVGAGRPHGQGAGGTLSAAEVFEAERLGALQEELLTALTENLLLVSARSRSLADQTFLLVLLLAVVPVRGREGEGGEISVQHSAVPQQSHPAAGTRREGLRLGGGDQAGAGLEARHGGVRGL